MIIPSDPVFEPNGTFVISVSERNGSANVSQLVTPIRFVLPLAPGVSDSLEMCLGRQPALVAPACH